MTTRRANGTGMTAARRKAETAGPLNPAVVRLVEAIALDLARQDHDNETAPRGRGDEKRSS